MNKKGEGLLENEAVKIILSVIAIAMLALVLFSLYKILTASKASEQAKQELTRVNDKVNLLSTQTTMLLTGPSNWYLLTQTGKETCVCECKKCNPGDVISKCNAPDSNNIKRCMPLTQTPLKSVVITEAIPINIKEISLSLRTENGVQIVEIKQV